MDLLNDDKKNLVGYKSTPPPPPPDYAADPSRKDRPSKSYGLGEGDQGSPPASLDYMGHLANDDVTAVGHNVGKKPKGITANTTIGKRGYRALPGSAVHEMGTSIGSMQVERAAMGTTPVPRPTPPDFISNKGDRTMATGLEPKPASKSDLRMSAKHHKDSVAFEVRHMRDHAAGMEKAQKVGDAESAAYHDSHRRHHEARQQEHMTALGMTEKKLRGKRGK